MSLSGEGTLWPCREGERVTWPLMVGGFPDLTHLLMLLGSPGIVGGSPV